MIKCMVFQVYYRIYSFRELEWKLKQDFWALRSIGIVEVPDHTTFCRRVKKIEESFYGELYRKILDELEPQSWVCYWDFTPLRSSKYDKEAKKGIGTRLGWFYRYKFHVIASEDLLPLSWDLTPANFYDTCEKAGIHLTTQVNMRRSKSPDSFQAFCRRQNWHYVHQGLGRKLLKKRSQLKVCLPH